MDDQLVIDSSGAWVRKTAQLIAEKPLLPPQHFGGLPCAADASVGDMELVKASVGNKFSECPI